MGIHAPFKFFFRRKAARRHDSQFPEIPAVSIFRNIIRLEGYKINSSSSRAIPGDAPHFLHISNLKFYYSSFFKTAAHARFDPVNPVCMLVLMVAGVFFIYSAQVYTGLSQFRMQIVWIGGGLAAYLFVSLLDYRSFLKGSHWIYLASIVILLLLWTPLAGAARHGAVRWLDFGFFSVQPSEAAKLGCLVITASILARGKIETFGESLRTAIKIGVAISIPMLLIFMQPDLGSALVIPPMVLSLLYVANFPRIYFGAVIGGMLLVIAIVAIDVRGYEKFLEENSLSPTTHRGQYEPHSLLPLRDYQRNRILSFVAPERIDPVGIGWNVRQSLISVGSGGAFGKGWQQGTQAQLGYLPRGVAHNDFIFSVLAEEKGFMGSALVVGLYGLLLANGVRVAGLARDRFGMMLALGVTIIFSVHVFINIGMTIGLMPITGLPLPFLSYGGSFMISCCILQGLVQSVYRFRKEH